MFGDQSKIQLGQYQLLEEVGSGGMATVYKAYQPSLDRFVAVKVMQSSDDPQFTTRFKREARAIASLQHHNILPIYDYGEQDGWLYFVLQYIEHGVTLSSLLARPISSLTALRLIGHVLIALDYAHTRGIIHRDVKPSNILMAAPNWPMLADFGIARMVGEDQRLTISGSIIGTAAYMAPEQALGRVVDARTDLYATGAMLYEMLTGQIPFGGDTPVVVLTKHVVEPPLPPRAINPDLSLALEAAVLRALAKEPADRYQSAAEMADELAWIATQCEQPLAQEQLIYLYHSSVEAFEQGQWNLAIARLARLLTIDPNYEDATDLLDAARQSQERAMAAAHEPFMAQQPQSTIELIHTQELATPAPAHGTPRENLGMPPVVIRAADARQVSLPQRPWAWPAVSAVLLFILLLGAIDMRQGQELTNQVASTGAAQAGIVAPPSLLAIGRGLINLFVAPARVADITATPTSKPSMLFLTQARLATPMLTPTASPSSVVERVSRGGEVEISAGPGRSAPGASDSSPGQPLATSGIPSQVNPTPRKVTPQIFVTATTTATLLTPLTPTAEQQSTSASASPTPVLIHASPTGPSLPAAPLPTLGAPAANPTSTPAATANLAQPSPTARATQPPSAPPQPPTSQPPQAPQPPTPQPAQAPSATSRPTQPPQAPTATPKPAPTQAPTATQQPVPTQAAAPPPQAPTATQQPVPTQAAAPPTQAPTATSQPAPTQAPTATKAPTATPLLGLPLPPLPTLPLPPLPPPLPTLPGLP